MSNMRVVRHCVECAKSAHRMGMLFLRLGMPIAAGEHFKHAKIHMKMARELKRDGV